MTTTAAFNLLQLPAVPLRQTIGALTATELFELHQCSKKTMVTLRQFEKANKTFKMEIDFQRNWVDIRGVQRVNALEIPEEGFGEKDVKTRKFCDTTVQVVAVDEKELNTYWPAGQRMLGTMTIAENFTKALGLACVEQLLIAPENPQKEILEWFTKSEMTLSAFNVSGASMDTADEVADIIFSDDFLKKCSNNFISLLQPSQNFCPSSFMVGKGINTNMLRLHHTHWLTGQQLLGFNVKSFTLYHSVLKNEDIKQYLTGWKNGSYSKLLRMSINVADGAELCFNSIVNGLEGEVQDDAPAGEQVAIIKREDGTTAEVVLKENRKHFEVNVE